MCVCVDVRVALRRNEKTEIKEKKRNDKILHGRLSERVTRLVLDRRGVGGDTAFFGPERQHRGLKIIAKDNS